VQWAGSSEPVVARGDTAAPNVQPVQIKPGRFC
jgi:hypothetical protein